VQLTLNPCFKPQDAVQYLFVNPLSRDSNTSRDTTQPPLLFSVINLKALKSL
jgi:hypothetical protein